MLQVFRTASASVRASISSLADVGPAFLIGRAREIGVLWLIPVALFAAILYQSEAGLNRPIIRSDGEAYYSYLRLYLIRHQVDFAALPMQRAPGTYGFRAHPGTGRLGSTYPVGTALCIAPFFLVGQLIAHVGGWPLDGWSDPYQWSVLAAGVCWFSIGVLALWRALATEVGVKGAAITILILTFSTNLLHYAVAEPSMAHIYAFGVAGATLWLGKVFWGAPGTLRAAALGAGCGLLFSIRSSDALLAAAVLYPALWRTNRFVLKTYWAPFAAGALAMALPQLAVATYYYGRPWINGYWGLRINWGQPRLALTMFSVQRGWLFWNPVAALGLAGLIAGLFKHERRWFSGTALLVLACATYLFSCWADPTFGSGFGHRSYVDFLPLLGFGIAAIYTRFQKPLRYMIALNLYLMVAYWNGYIDGSGTTWHSFVRVLRTPFQFALGIEPPQDSQTPKGLAAEVTVTKARRDGDVVVIDATTHNSGPAVWLAEPGKGRVFLAVRTFGRADCQGAATGEWRFPVTSVIAPGQAGFVTATIPVSSISGGPSSYFCVEMMAAGVAWFRDVGLSSRPVSVTIDR